MAPLCSPAPSLLKPSDQQQMEEQPPRRSANYAQTLWTDDKIPSLTSNIIKVYGLVTHLFLMHGGGGECRQAEKSERSSEAASQLGGMERLHFGGSLKHLKGMPPSTLCA